MMVDEVDEVDDEVTGRVSVREHAWSRCAWCDSITRMETDEFCAWCTALRHAARFATIAVLERVLADKRAGHL